MDQMMVVTTFILGIVLIVFAMIALSRRNPGAGKGEFSFLGIKISGTGTALFLGAGIFLVFSARGWQHSLEKVTTLNEKVVETQKEVLKVGEEKKEIAKTALELDARVKEQFEINRKLLSRVPQRDVQSLGIRPEVLTAPSPVLSPQTRQKIEGATRLQ